MTTLATNPIAQNQINGGVPAIAIDEATAQLTGFQSQGGSLRSLNFEISLLKAYLSAGLLTAANNLSDLVDAVAARGNLGAKNLYYVTGNLAPAAALGIVNDFAINDNGALYEKTGATTWASRIDLTTDAELAAAIAAHAAASDPHPVYLTQAEGDGRYPLSAALSETIDDRVGALLVAGANISLTYNDAGNTLTIASTVSGGAGGGASGIPYTYNDADPPTAAGQIRTLQASLNVATEVAINAADSNGDSATDITARLKTGAIFTIAKDAANYVRFEATADYASGSVAVVVRAEQGTIVSGDVVYLAIASDSPSSPSGGSGLTSQTITASQTAADGVAYICDSPSLIEVTLPTTGSRLAVSNQGTGGFKIRNQSGVVDQIGTTLVDSITKYIASTNQYSYVEMFKLGTRWLVTVQANVQYGFDVLNNAKSLLHFNETAGSTFTVDAVDNSRVVSLTGAAVIASGGRFGNCLRLPSNGSSSGETIPSALGTSDFCIEWFMSTTNAFNTWRYLHVYRGATPGSDTAASTANGDGLILSLENDVGGFGSASSSNPEMRILGFVANNLASSSWFTGSLSNFIHCAIVRNGTTFSFYSDGVVRNTVDLSVVNGSFNSVYGNSLGTNPINIRLGGLATNGARTPDAIFDEFRLTIGDPVYTAAFTPPTAEFAYP